MIKKEIYEQLIFITRQQVIENPDITDGQLDGYVKYLGIFAPNIRDMIVKEAKKL